MQKLNVHGIPVYTNDNLKNKLKEIINNNKKLSPVVKTLLISYVDKNIIIPIINEQSKIKQLILKLRRIQPYNYYGTMFNNKCYILIEGISPNDIVDTSLHELMHYIHRLKNSQFNNVNLDLYKKFYSYYYKQLFETNSYNKELFDKFIKILIDGEFNPNNLIDSFKEYITLPKDSIDSKIKGIFNVFDAIDNNKLNTISYNDYILMYIRKTYRYLFKDMDYQTGVGQELINPGEIIAVLSTINPNHPNIIKSLKLIS